MKQRMPYALLVNDIHCGQDTIAEFNRNWREALGVCKEYGISLIILGGDMWQSRASQPLSVLRAVREIIEEICDINKIDLLIVPGNHDKVDCEDYYSYNHLFKGIEGLTVVDDKMVIKNDNFHLYLLPYFPEKGSSSKRIEELSEQLDSNMVNILYCHQGIRGGLGKPSDDELPSTLFKSFRSVLVGHYHNRKIVKPNIEYIGSSRQHNYGEDEDKGYTILFDNGTTKFVRNEVNTRYYTIEGAYDDFINGKIEFDPKYFNDERYRIRARVRTDQNTAEVDKDWFYERGVDKVEIINPNIEFNEKTTETSLESKYDKNSLKNAYRDFCGNDNDNPELGIFYLEKI